MYLSYCQLLTTNITKDGQFGCIQNDSKTETRPTGLMLTLMHFNINII